MLDKVLTPLFGDSALKERSLASVPHQQQKARQEVDFLLGQFQPIHTEIEDELVKFLIAIESLGARCHSRP